nr:MAG TPA: hypothetical protein [Caudoviricetes sp.]
MNVFLFGISLLITQSTYFLTFTIYLISCIRCSICSSKGVPAIKQIGQIMLPLRVLQFELLSCLHHLFEM